MPFLKPQPIKRMSGDPRWAAASPLASYAPIVVLTLLALSIVQIVLGAIWVASLQGSLNFPLIIQPIILPCISLFNTVPSGHLHLLARSNPPLMAVWFSSILAVCYYVAAIFDLAVCNGSGNGDGGGIQSVCWSGKTPNAVSESVWSSAVGLWLVSAVLYTVHVVQARQARKYQLDLKRRAREQGVQLSELEYADPEARARREEKARERWRKIVDL